MITYHDIKANGFVDMWDLGPERPLPPPAQLGISQVHVGTGPH
jgi:hypothetical protein